MDPILDARVAALRANGVVVQDLNVNAIKGYISARRTYLANRLAGATNVPLTALTARTNGNLLTLRGTAPIQAQSIWINGRPYPITWPAVSNIALVPTNWAASVVLQPGMNNVTVQGYDAQGNAVTSLITVNADYAGPVIQPKDQVVITEIMYHPAQAGTEYVELFNIATNFTFDLSGWRLEELSFQFPAGSLLLPNAFVVLAQNRFHFGAAYPGQSAPFE